MVAFVPLFGRLYFFHRVYSKDEVYAGHLHLKLIPVLFLGAMALLIAWVIWLGNKQPSLVYYVKNFIVLLLLAFAGWLACHHL
jgi:hypothetical protein